MELTKLKNNILMNQSGGDNVRTAILINDNQVLEFYNNQDGLVTGTVTYLGDYLMEEFINYRHEMKKVYEVLDNYIEIFENIHDVKILESEYYYSKLLINDNYIIELIEDEVHLEL